MWKNVDKKKKDVTCWHILCSAKISDSLASFLLRLNCIEIIWWYYFLWLTTITRQTTEEGFIKSILRRVVDRAISKKRFCEKSDFFRWFFSATQIFVILSTRRALLVQPYLECFRDHACCTHKIVLKNIFSEIRERDGEKSSKFMCFFSWEIFWV